MCSYILTHSGLISCQNYQRQSCTCFIINNFYLNNQFIPQPFCVSFNYSLPIHTGAVVIFTACWYFFCEDCMCESVWRHACLCVGGCEHELVNPLVVYKWPKLHLKNQFREATHLRMMAYMCDMAARSRGNPVAHAHRHIHTQTQISTITRSDVHTHTHAHRHIQTQISTITCSDVHTHTHAHPHYQKSKSSSGSSSSKSSASSGM